jgi:hypothetical protein
VGHERYRIVDIPAKGPIRSMAILKASLIKLGEFALPKSLPCKNLMDKVGSMLTQDIAGTAELVGIKSTINTSSNEQIRMIVYEAIEAVKPEFHNTSVVDPKKEQAAIEANLELIRHKFQKVVPGLEVSTLISQIKKYKNKQGMNYIDITREYLESNLRGHMWVLVNSSQYSIEFKTSEEVADMIREERDSYGKILPGIITTSLIFGAAFVFFASKHSSLALGSLSLGLCTLPFILRNVLKYRELNALYSFFQEQEGLITKDPKKLKELDDFVSVALNDIRAAKDTDGLENSALNATSTISAAKVDKYNKRKFYVGLLKAIVESTKKKELENFFLAGLLGDIEDSMQRTFPAREDRIAIFVEAGAVAKRPVNGDDH